MTTVVTGVAGFIGSHLAAKLLADGQDVVGIDSFTAYYDPGRKHANLARIKHPRLTILELDLASDDLGSALEDATRVYHLAGQPGVRLSWGSDFNDYVRQNITATHRLLESMRGSQARLVVASSSSVYGDAERYPTSEDVVPRPMSPYGVTKLCAEQLALAYRRSAGVDARCVRYFTVYGPFQRPDMAFAKFISAATSERPIDLYGDGLQTRDFTYVADAVDATIRAGEVDDPGPAVFNVGGGARVTMRHVLELLGDLLGGSLQVRELPAQPGDVRDTAADLTRTSEILGWKPSVRLADGLREQVDAASG